MEDNPRHSIGAPFRLNRRRIIQGAGVGLAAAFPARVLSASDRKHLWNLWQQENPGATPTTVEEYVPVALSASEWESLTAVVDRLFPKDEASPGGAETGAHIYIDRKLSTVYTHQLSDYQTGLAAIEASIESGFSAVSSDEQDAALREVEDGKLQEVPDGFFNVLLEHTRQGMFCDPIHGGNREFMGWDLIGYSGIKLVWSAEEQAIDAEVEPVHISVEEYGGEAR